MRRIVLRSATRPVLTRRDYWLAAGAADVVTMSSFVLSTAVTNRPNRLRARTHGLLGLAMRWWQYIDRTTGRPTGIRRCTRRRP